MHESESNLYKLLEKFKQNLGIRWYLEGTVNFVRYSTTEGMFQNASPYQL